MSNKQTFVKYENEWMTVRSGFIRELSNECKSEVERIYKEEIDINWLPNKWCKACYFDAIRRLIIKFGL
jgi:hypothetical protein